MILLIFILTSLLAEQNRVISGTVVVDGQLAMGCKVRIKETGQSEFTNSDGGFVIIQNKQLARATLIVSYAAEYSATTVVEGVTLSSGNIRFDSIPIRSNKMIRVDQYNALNKKGKQAYAVVRHYTNLLGYIHKSQVDTVQLRTHLTSERSIRYRYEVKDNSIHIEANELIK